MVSRSMAVTIDPEILAARALMATATGPFDIMALPPAKGRALIDKAAMVLNDGLPEMASVEDHDVAGIRVRIYTPREVTAKGFTYYLHGGGWFACSVDTHDRMLRMLAEKTGGPVFSPDYRHAPEHPYPAPLDDCAKAWDWIERRAAGPFAFAGDSAGANMALALAMRLRDAGRAMPAGLALLYGCFDPGEDTLSQRAFGRGGYGLTVERMAWYLGNYLKGAEAAEASPLRLRADLSELPPVFLGIAEADTVADDSRLLAARLGDAGVPAEVRVWKGAVHGFLQMTRDAGIARRAVADTAHALRRWIGARG
jgi:acetyl esterase